MARKFKFSKDIKKAGQTARGLGKAAVAGASGAALVAANFGKSIRDAAVNSNVPAKKNKKDRGVIEMKKSTFVGVLVFLAAIAGALGALYVYVLRREKELDEYEKLLFSEDFSDDFPEDEAFDISMDMDEEDEEAEEEPAEAPAAE